MAKVTKTSEVRERILSTAGRLFYLEGVGRVGVDRLIAESRVAKRSFYRHFPSKTALVVAWLGRRHGEWMARFASDCEAAYARRGPAAGLGLLADGLAAWFRRPGFRGCAFINVIAESGTSPEPEVRTAALSHKRELLALLRRWCARLGMARPGETAERAMLVVEGMIVRSQMTGDPRVISRGRRLLEDLSSALEPRGSRMTRTTMGRAL